MFLHLSKDGHVGFPMAMSTDALVGEFYPLGDPSNTVRPRPLVHPSAHLPPHPPVRHPVHPSVIPSAGPLSYPLLSACPFSMSTLIRATSLSSMPALVRPSAQLVCPHSLICISAHCLPLSAHLPSTPTLLPPFRPSVHPPPIRPVCIFKKLRINFLCSKVIYLLYAT